MKKIYIILILITLSSLFIITNANQAIFKGTTQCAGQKDYAKYTCYVQKICKVQEYGKNNKKIANIDEKYEKGQGLEQSKEKYRKIQNNIYKCAIIGSQKKSYKELIEILQKTDNSGILKTKVIPQIKLKLDKLDGISNKENCVDLGKPNKKVIRKIVLDQSSFEYCKYIYFLDYLQNKEDNSVKEQFPKDKDSISIKNIGNKSSQAQNSISSEINHTLKLYPVAFETYLEYDDYLKLHILLEIIKQDYRALRDLLYQNLHPINQTVYKVINAQSK